MRALLGLFLIMGAVGSQDYAIEAGEVAPSLWLTVGYCVAGFTLVYYGLIKHIVIAK
jgi:hypothetical protein